jgi:hypothetical protein
MNKKSKYSQFNSFSGSEEYQDRVNELAGEIAFNLTETVVFKQIILQKDLENEVDAYYSEEEEISYGDLEYETILALEYDGYEVLDTPEYTFRIGQTIAEDIYEKSQNYSTSIQYIEKELDYYDYPDEIDDEEIIDEVINNLIDYGYTITKKDVILPFQYHCTPNSIITPYENDKNKNIKGLELEISDEYYIVEQALAELADNNIIATPENWDNPFHEKANIALEEDNSVKYELIFRAQTNNKIMEEIEKIQELETYVSNHSGTSAHIHINRTYIEEELGLTETDIIKAAEFLSYPLFLISGRIKETAHEWARSQLHCRMESNLAEKAKCVDRLTEVRYAKHGMVNCLPEDTIELRIFSNKCNFNKNVINMYLETVDFIIELAEYMKDKKYNKELKNLIPLCKNHFEKFGETLDFFNTKEEIMDIFKEPEILIKEVIKNEWIGIDNHISRFMHWARTEPRKYDTLERFVSMVKILNREYRFNFDFNINPEKTDVQELAGEIRRDIRKTYEIKMEVVNFE